MVVPGEGLNLGLYVITGITGSPASIAGFQTCIAQHSSGPFGEQASQTGYAIQCDLIGWTSDERLHDGREPQFSHKRKCSAFQCRRRCALSKDIDTHCIILLCLVKLRACCIYMQIKQFHRCKYKCTLQQLTRKEWSSITSLDELISPQGILFITLESRSVFCFLISAC